MGNNLEKDASYDASFVLLIENGLKKQNSILTNYSKQCNNFFNEIINVNRNQEIIQ